MRKFFAGGVVALVIALMPAGMAYADHNGPYCEAETRSGIEIFNTPGHDYCD